MSTNTIIWFLPHKNCPIDLPQTNLIISILYEELFSEAKTVIIASKGKQIYT